MAKKTKSKILKKKAKKHKNNKLIYDINDPRISSEGYYLGDGVYVTPGEAAEMGLL